MPRQKRNHDRPFPWRCGNCDEKEVYRTPTLYKSTIKYEGRPYEVEIAALEAPTCRNCGEVVFDNHASDQINQGLRQKLRLLQPEQIRAGRTKLGLSQKDFAAQLGVAEESVSRWETGALMQSRVVDRQIRLYFELPAAREALGAYENGKAIGDVVKTEGAAETPSKWTVSHAEHSPSQADMERQLGPVFEDFRLKMTRTSDETCSALLELWTRRESNADR